MSSIIIIAKNISDQKIILEDLGKEIELNQSVNLTSEFSISEIDASKNLYQLITEEKIVINDGTRDLSIPEALDLVTIETDILSSDTIGNLAACQLKKTNDFTVTQIWSSVLFSEIDIENSNDIKFESNKIKINTSGLYLITYSIDFENITLSDTTVFGRVIKNNSIVLSSSEKELVVETNLTRNLTITFLSNLIKYDELELQVKALLNISAINVTQISILRLNGVIGEPGPISSIDVYKNNSLIRSDVNLINFINDINITETGLNSVSVSVINPEIVPTTVSLNGFEINSDLHNINLINNIDVSSSGNSVTLSVPYPDKLAIKKDNSLLSSDITSLNITGSPSVSVLNKEATINISFTPANIIVVAKNGGNYTSIQAAINAVYSLATTSNQYLIYIAPGIYTESITLYDNVFLKGHSKETVNVIGQFNYSGSIKNIVSDISINTSNLTSVTINTSGIIFFYNCDITSTWSANPCQTIQLTLGTSYFINSNIYLIKTVTESTVYYPYIIRTDNSTNLIKSYFYNSKLDIKISDTTDTTGIVYFANDNTSSEIVINNSICNIETPLLSSNYIYPFYLDSSAGSIYLNETQVDINILSSNTTPPLISFYTIGNANGSSAAKIISDKCKLSFKNISLSQVYIGSSPTVNDKLYIINNSIYSSTINITSTPTRYAYFGSLGTYEVSLFLPNSTLAVTNILFNETTATSASNGNLLFNNNLLKLRTKNIDHNVNISQLISLLTSNNASVNSSTATAIPWTSSTILDPAYSFSTVTNPTRISITNSGIYDIKYKLILNSSSNAAVWMKTYIRLNGTTIINESTGYGYLYTTSSISAAQQSFLYNLTAGSYIELLVVRHSGSTTTTVRVVPNESNLVISLQRYV